MQTFLKASLIVLSFTLFYRCYNTIYIHERPQRFRLLTLTNYLVTGDWECCAGENKLFIRLDESFDYTFCGSGKLIDLISYVLIATG